MEPTSREVNINKQLEIDFSSYLAPSHASLLTCLCYVPKFSARGLGADQRGLRACNTPFHKNYWGTCIAVFVCYARAVSGWPQWQASAGWTVIFVNSGNACSHASTAKREARQLEYT